MFSYLSVDLSSNADDDDDDDDDEWRHAPAKVKWLAVSINVLKSGFRNSNHCLPCNYVRDDDSLR